MSLPRALLIIGTLTIPTGAFADVQTDFPLVVAQILMGQTKGPISLMSDAKKGRVIDCVNEVLINLPKGKKSYILEGGDLDEQERRFGRIIFENHAEWLQKIAGGCASLAMRRD